MHISSRAFDEGARVPSEYTCDAVGATDAGDGRAGVNPPLMIEDIPEGAKTLVLLMEDPDSPKGIWDHWVVYDIPVQSDSFYIEEGEEPEGAAGQGTVGKTGYMGPCPHDGEHHYIFTAYALSDGLNLPEDVVKAVPNKPEVLQAMQGKVIATAILTATYSRTAGKL